MYTLVENRLPELLDDPSNFRLESLPVLAVLRYRDGSIAYHVCTLTQMKPMYDGDDDIYQLRWYMSGPDGYETTNVVAWKYIEEFTH